MTSVINILISIRQNQFSLPKSIENTIKCSTSPLFTRDIPSSHLSRVINSVYVCTHELWSYSFVSNFQVRLLFIKYDVWKYNIDVCSTNAIILSDAAQHERKRNSIKLEISWVELSSLHKIFSRRRKWWNILFVVVNKPTESMPKAKLPFGYLSL